MKKFYSFLLSVVFIVTTSFVAYAEEITLGGGAPPIEKAIKPVKDAFAKSTGINVKTIAYGPKFAITDLEKGVIDAAVLFLSPEEISGLIKKENLDVKDLSSFKNSVISEDKVVLIVNKNNPVSSLTKEQAKDLFTGKISNWKEVGGKDEPVIVVQGRLVQGIYEIVSRKIMDGEKYPADVLWVETGKDVINAVQTNNEAIGVASIALLDGTIKTLQQPQISVPVFVYTKGEPSQKVQKLIDFIKTEGHKYIK